MFALLSAVKPSIVLDYGVDCICGENAGCEICERGMRFRAEWQFEVGTVLHVSFTLQKNTPCLVDVEGLVVDCFETAQNEYRTTLAFVDPPEELRAVIGKASGCIQLCYAPAPGADSTLR